MGLVLCLLLFFITRTSALNTITPGQSIKDGETLVSAGGSFELGFFSPGNSKSRYLGIWYKKVSSGTVVWVANREASISDTSGVLSISDRGILAILNSINSAVWSSNTSRNAKESVAQLLESGNFVVKDRNDNDPENLLWQSFDYPCDTFLPGMKIGKDFVTGFDRYISSRRSTEDPAPGQYSIRIDPRGLPQFVLKKGPEILFRAGSWNGVKMHQCSSLKLIQYIRMSLIKRSIWNERKNDWEVFSTAQADQCSIYAFCGAYATCSTNKSPPCTCLEGFVRSSASSTDLNSVDWSDGCIRRTPLTCDDGDSFLKQTGLKIPDTSISWTDMSMNLKECENLCLKNCSCTAYANLDFREGGHGCLLWFGDLIDISDFTEGGQDIYIRLATSDLNHIQRKGKSKEKQKAGIIIISVIIATGMMIVSFLLYTRKKKLRKAGEQEKEELELPVFDLATIAKATNNFSSNNQLGQGGFGPVYKGTLIEGQEIAVKRLSKNSGQGLEEFKNEVTLIAKLQHRNLVKLFGCCIRRDERMLIYEYMPNKSLDYFIFDPTRSKFLDWHSRMHIVDGIARGLLYLHHDSRLRIIHRDVKASNILLDNSMNPKISDFGLARKFGSDQTEANTKRVVGTYGYMSPEYAFDGLFSMKSDVFSFGVLVLEIVAGKRNRGFSHPEHDHNLLGHAWRLWMEERPLELTDNALGNSYIVAEVLRCINVALLCVQRHPEDRPNMSMVLLMLSGQTILPQPKQPGFFIERNLPLAYSKSVKHEPFSAYGSTVTVLEPPSLTSALLFNVCCPNSSIDLSKGKLKEKQKAGIITISVIAAIGMMIVAILLTSALNTIKPGQSIKDGETLVSAGGSFELGFFSPGNSKSRYLGICTNSAVWSSNTSRNAKDPVAQLLGSGNFVVKDRKDNDPKNLLWQSFDYPCDTFLPGMKIGRNFVTGFERHISSRKSTENPAPGQYSLGIDPRGLPQFALKKGPEMLYRAGPWNGVYFRGKAVLEANPVHLYEFILTKNEVYFKYETRNSSIFSRYLLNPSGLMQRSIWNERKNDWEVFSTLQADQCSIYAYCGAYATCTTNKSPPCTCLEGFVRRSASSRDLNPVDWSDGCIRRTPLTCDDGDSFLKHTGLKIPDTSMSWADMSMNLKECEKLCLKNCSCTAYANLDIREAGRGCLLWFGDLIDISDSTEGGQDLYIRLATSDLNIIQRKGKLKEKKKAGIITISVIIATGMTIVAFLLYVRMKKLRKVGEKEKEELDLPIFDFATIAKATNDFSSNNQLGQGGFGPVYKNFFLCQSCISHFYPTRSKFLDWHSRMHIVDGIARGLLYLHHDSRLRIIHRDLKASNILLDNSMNPKISDFGLARKFGDDQTEANTKRVVGTYGYMSPEYAFDGLFSMKSDFFSFGVLVLEIVAGKRNRGFSHPEHDHNLLGHAWRLWMEERPLELIDNALGNSYIVAEVLRCINVALLCVQRHPEDRPNMSMVLLMLSGETILPKPKQPGFFIERNLPLAYSKSVKHEPFSVYGSNITELEPR
ncbi:S-locus lectin protein kinase family protein, putative [Theobroma cacao]|uniref:non-specific serine/threonine protein kinase n=1 Tax=Theobroma cacao TaxID=3641 RepID=A0A061F6S4_THECC|nr:S-locus lectin protein kinase family protein, putative [Theobroma cacao]